MPSFLALMKDTMKQKGREIHKKALRRKNQTKGETSHHTTLHKKELVLSFFEN